MRVSRVFCVLLCVTLVYCMMCILCMQCIQYSIYVHGTAQGSYCGKSVFVRNYN
jgi:hypothetical protein